MCSRHCVCYVSLYGGFGSAVPWWWCLQMCVFVYSCFSSWEEKGGWVGWGWVVDYINCYKTDIDRNLAICKSF